MTTPNKKPKHRATFSRDKRKGGYLIRVQGPQSNRFAEKTVPVTLKDGSTKQVELESLVWSGKDKESGEPVTLYHFVPEEMESQDVEF